MTTTLHQAPTTDANVVSPADLAAALGQPPPTPEQAAVIGAPAEPALVVAGAGAGKTETMAARVVWLVANGYVPPEQVLGLTFTRKAARQLADRVRRRLRRLAGSALLDDIDPSGLRTAQLQAGEPTVLTYHAYAGRLLAEHGLRLPVPHGSRVLSETAAWQLAHRAVATWEDDLGTEYVPATVTEHVLALAGELGEHLVDEHELAAYGEWLATLIEDAPRGPRQAATLRQDLRKVVDTQRLRARLLPLVAEYQRRKRADGALDFADQMAMAARLATDHVDVVDAERSRYRAVLLDEYQDTGHAQRVLLRALFGAGSGKAPLPVTAVGDPVQAIYGWRGASAANLPRFATDFPRGGTRRAVEPAHRYGLLTSFRNPPEVLSLANEISAPLRGDLAALRPRDGAPAADVRCALLADVAAERAWVAEEIAGRWQATLDADGAPPTAAVLVRRRADMAPIAESLRARGVPVEVVGIGGLLDEPEVADLVAMLRVLADPLAGTAAARLLTGARWRLGAADLAALWQRARHLAAPDGGEDGEPLDITVPERAELTGLIDAVDDPGDESRYSADGYRRIRAFGSELAALRRRMDQSLPELVADVERTMRLDVEVAARQHAATGRVHLDAFADVVTEFAESSSNPTLLALVDYLAAAEHAEDGLQPGEVEVATDRVQVLTVHAAKGLEWQLVAVPHLVDGVFPGTKRSGCWLTAVGELPASLRGDAADLPQLTLHGDEDRKQVADAVTAHKDAFKERHAAEERRLAYVAVTRAEQMLLTSAHWWTASGSRPAGPSDLLTELADAVTADEWLGDIAHWAPPPGEDEANPNTAETTEARWPADPLAPRRAAVSEGALLVRQELAAGVAVDGAAADGANADGGGNAGMDVHCGGAVDAEADAVDTAAAAGGVDSSGVDAGGAAGGGTDAGEAAAEGAVDAGGAAGGGTDTGDDAAAGRNARDSAVAEGGVHGGADDPEGWAADTEVLLAERARARATAERIALPDHLSVSQLVELAEDPDALAARIRRPLPSAPNAVARRGTAFHEWLERRFTHARLLEFDDLPGAADTDAAVDADLETLREAFERSEWATRTPHDVEVPFVCEVDGLLLRGRLDAVFADPDGGWTVVDWKTGAVPGEQAMRSLSVQLAAYRVAWAALADVDVATVRAAFHYVRADRTVRPADLRDAAGLRALLRAVPQEPGGSDV